jgi:tetratricopeptide (TPR) repeat protein
MKNVENLPDLEGRRILANNDKTRVILSVFLTPAQGPMDSKGLREYSWARVKKMPFKKETVKKYEAGEWAFLEYFIKDVKDFKGINQKNVFAYLVKGDTWIDYHLSKVSYKPADEKFFKNFINSVKVLEPFSPSSMENFQFGSYFYLKKKFMKAIVYYEQALAQEKQNPLLGKNLGRVLIDNLGMAYGLTGNLEMSKRTFEYGISKDPTFPMYYYNLACTYAELNNLESAIQNLKIAARYRSNMIPGEEWPDPFQDSSFKRFLNNKKFVEAAKAFR